jgi:hypothetical protein
MELQAEWIYPRSPEAIAADEPQTGVRVTVGQASALDMHRYRRLVAEAWAWFWEHTKTHWKPAGEHKAALVPDDAPEWAMLDIGLRRAYMLATLRRVEDYSDGTWAAIELPGEWATIEGMANHCPAALFEAWAGAARECNPGLFWSGDDPKARSNGGWSVRTPGAS